MYSKLQSLLGNSWFTVIGIIRNDKSVSATTNQKSSTNQNQPIGEQLANEGKTQFRRKLASEIKVAIESNNTKKSSLTFQFSKLLLTKLFSSRNMYRPFTMWSCLKYSIASAQFLTSKFVESCYFKPLRICKKIACSECFSKLDFGTFTLNLLGFGVFGNSRLCRKLTFLVDNNYFALSFTKKGIRQSVRKL